MRLRTTILRRDPLCTVCRKAPSAEVDHRIPLAHGGHPTAQTNLAGVCASCHLALTLEDRRGA